MLVVDYRKNYFKYSRVLKKIKEENLVAKWSDPIFEHLCKTPHYLCCVSPVSQKSGFVQIGIKIKRREVQLGRMFSGQHYRKYIVTIVKPFLNLRFFTPSLIHSSTTGCHSFDDHLSSNQDGGKSKNVVNLGAIRQGMKRFQFLLNCCEPGTIPDASILAAALDLVSFGWNLLMWFPIPVNSANGGKHESLIITLTVGWCFILFPQH